MERDKYIEILDKLPIKNPTSEDMAMVCPHLRKEQAIAAFNNGSGCVACPPLRIRGGFQIIHFYEESEGCSSVLELGSAGRTRQSYKDGSSHSDMFCEYNHVGKAIKFAEDNWSDELILVSWESTIEIVIQDPSKLVQSGFQKNQPETVMSLYVALNRSPNEIRNDHSRPEIELIDDAIVEMTFDTKIWHELEGGLNSYFHSNCAYCGDGLGLSVCEGCGHKFKDNGYRSGPASPLSEKMVEFIQQNGHVFEQDPNIVLDRERNNYEQRKKVVKK